MPRHIALLICVLFILYVLRMDAKRNPNTSLILWLPWAWFGIFASRAVSYWFGTGINTDSADYYLEGSPFDRNVFLFLIVSGLVILLIRKVDWPSILKNNKFLFIYIFYLLLSTLWSDYTFVSFKRWIKELGNIMMVIIVLTDQNPIDSAKTIIKRLAYVIMPLSIMTNRYFPEISRMFSETGVQSFVGITQNKNSLGALCAACGLFFLWNMLILWRTRKENNNIKEIFINLLYFIMIVSLLHNANSATSIFVIIIGICIVFVLGISSIKHNVKTFKYYVLFFIIILVLANAAFDVRSFITSSLGRDETLTGRTNIWEECLKMKSNPLIGTGYESFFLGDRADYFYHKYSSITNQAHNGYLEIYLNLGIIGLTLLAFFIFATYRNISKNLLTHNNYDYQCLRLAFFVVFLLMNITEAYFKGTMWLFFLLIAMVPPKSQTIISSGVNIKNHSVSV